MLVEVQHGDGAHLPGRATGLRALRRRHLDEVRVRVLLEGDEGAVAGAHVGVVPLGGDDEVEADLLEVDDERVAAAERLVHLVVAVEAQVAAHAPFGFHGGDLHEGGLQ